ncbi:DUF6702 family protein [Arcicella sp. DC2W]|uniref:DUF6702 family protein n=1 Tax=Arcicella gelida TaxID=2984195 RepID=A0ABU5S6F5_9BACT|nr:DUF6702 family protein [Arcicella sp. DC2W]MEA5404068.1 DUF6702 family protein [Arcicella sp. DC2W]
MTAIKNNNIFKPVKMSNLGRFLLLGIIILSSSFKLSNNAFHAFHTSLTEMRYNAKSKGFEVSLRVFTDDLEKVLSHDNQNKKIVIENNDKNDALVEQYVKKHFMLVNSKNQLKAIQYIGKEKEGDATWIYLELPINEAISGLKLKNDVLIDMFEDQTNIVNVFVKEEKTSFIFNAKTKIFSINFE